MRYVIQVPDAVTRVGDQTAVRIGVDTEGALVNVFDVTVRIPQHVEVTSWDTTQSLVNLWIREPTYHPEQHVFTLTGGVPGGFRGRAILADLSVRPERTGSFVLVIEPTSRAYLNDGLGTQTTVTVVQDSLHVTAAPQGIAEWTLIAIAATTIIWGVFQYIRSRRA